MPEALIRCLAEENVSWDGSLFSLTFSDGFKMMCSKLVNAAARHLKIAAAIVETFCREPLMERTCF